MPEALGVVDGDFGELAGEGCCVDFAKGVGAGSVVFEVGAEDGLFEIVGDGVEEGFGLLRLDGVNAAKR